VEGVGRGAVRISYGRRSRAQDLHLNNILRPMQKEGDEIFRDLNLRNTARSEQLILDLSLLFFGTGLYETHSYHQ